jgi:hypothetical protein
MEKEKVVKEIIEYLEEVYAGGVEEIATINSDQDIYDPESIVYLSGSVGIVGVIIKYLEREYLGKV